MVKVIGGIAVIGAILMAVTAATVPRELGLDSNQVVTVYIAAVVVGLAGIWLSLRRNQA